MNSQDTQSTTDAICEQQGWVFRPMNIPVMIVDPPFAVEVRDAQNLYAGLAGDLHLIEYQHKLSIDDQVHQQLLDRSVAEYRGIWKTLADK
jgi:hypothetical protein